jgi:peptidoglycan/xylan/chitin deacetylase (PgdA/CDA1 family)
MNKSPLVALLSLGFCFPSRAAEQLPNLSDAKPAARFAVTDITWPAKPGDAEICLWKDDKIAPVSFTVDDNWASEVPWWMEQSEKYGNFPITWFIITKKVGGRSNGGTWDLWREAVARGHDVQSHTHTHLHTEEPDWQSIEWEYAESKKLIEENMPGHRARILAYPGGPKSKLNSEEAAGKLYAGARWATGTLLPVNAMPYLGVRAITESSFDNPKAPWADPKRILTPGDKVFRTWCVPIYHGAGDKSVERPFFKWIADNKDKLWLGTFCEVSLYAQERDTAKLEVTENTSSRVGFTLTDRMDDNVFDGPLTVKVRLPDKWKTVAGTQAGKPTAARFVEHEGKPYALVQAVPDRGPVVLVAK